MKPPVSWPSRSKCGWLRCTRNSSRPPVAAPQAPDSGGDEGNGNLAPLGKVGGAVVLKSEQGNKLPEMDRRVSTLQAPVRLTLLSGVEGEIAEFGGPSGELRLRPTVSDDRKSVHVELSYRYPGHPGSVTSIKENIPSGSVLAVSVGERVSTGRSENKTPILGDVPFLKRFFTNVGIGRERLLFVLILTPQIVAEQQKTQETIRSRDVPGTPLRLDIEEGMKIDAIEDNLPDTRSP